MADRVIMPRALDSNGNPVPGARAYFYEINTTTPITVYSDQAGTIPHTQPVEADSDGVFAAVFTTQNVRLDVWSTYGDDSSLPGFPSDYWYKSQTTSSGASAITFTPITGNTATNVQTAIANLTAKWNAVTTWALDFLTASTASTARTKLGLGGLATLNILDEDDMATNSATRPPSQQSTKAYVDNEIAAIPRQCIAYGTLDTDAATLAWLYRDGFSATVTDNGVGDYTVQFTTTQADTQYSYQITCGGAGGTGGRYFVTVGSRTTSGFRVYITDINGVAADPIEASIAVFK